MTDVVFIVAMAMIGFVSTTLLLWVLEIYKAWRDKDFPAQFEDHD